MFDSPRPPGPDLVMPDTMQDVLIVVMAVAGIAAFVFAWRESRRRGDWVPLYAAAGGGLAIFYEPVADMMVLASYPEIGQHTWIDLFGREIPVFIGLLFLWYFAPFVIVFSRLADRGFTAGTWWGLFGAALVGSTIFEMVLLQIDTAWVYYGDHPFVVLDVPLWKPFTDVAFLCVVSAGVYGIARFLPPRRHWLIVPAVPMLMMGSQGISALPGAAALYSTDDSFLIALGGLGTMAVTGLIVWALGLFFLGGARSSSPL